jgi:hypothetical protein
VLCAKHLLHFSLHTIVGGGGSALHLSDMIVDRVSFLRYNFFFFISMRTGVLPYLDCNRNI